MKEKWRNRKKRKLTGKGVIPYVAVWNEQCSGTVLFAGLKIQLCPLTLAW